METLYALHQSRWEGRAASSLSAARRRAFLTIFAARASEAGWLRLRFLELEGAPVAASFGWLIGERYAVYQAGFDPRYAAYSPGFVLLADMVEEACTEGARECDFLRGDEEYKWRFTNTSRQASTWVISPRLHPLWVMAQVQGGSRAAVRRLPEPARMAVKRSWAARRAP
jgi:CelD/BcsL family acetyltransferase involved in cellulose biosynthesis